MSSNKVYDDADLPVVSYRGKKPQKNRTQMTNRSTNVQKTGEALMKTNMLKQHNPTNKNPSYVLYKNIPVSLLDNISNYDPVDIIMSCMVQLVGKFPESLYNEENIQSINGNASRDDLQIAKFLGFAGYYFLSRPLTKYSFHILETQWKTYCKNVKEKDMCNKLIIIQPALESFSIYIHLDTSKKIKHVWLDFKLNKLNQYGERHGSPELEKIILKMYEFAAMTQIKAISDMISAKNCSAILIESVASQAAAFKKHETEIKEKLGEKFKYAGLLNCPELSVLHGRRYPDLLEAAIAWGKSNNKIGKGYVTSNTRTTEDKKVINKMAKKKF